MADWQNKISIGDLHKKHEVGEIKTEELAKEVSRRLRVLIPKIKCPSHLRESLTERLTDIADGFEHDSFEVEDYDSNLADLYDIGDMSLDSNPLGKKLLWVDTF